MFTAQKLRLFYDILLILNEATFQKYGNTYVYVEEKDEIVNLHERCWDRSFEDLSPKQQVLKVMVQESTVERNIVVFKIWSAAAGSLEFQFSVNYCYHIKQCDWMVRTKRADAIVRKIHTEDLHTLLPFTSSENVIFYKAGEFELSSTYFIDGLSTELWIFIWSFFFFFFLGLLISVKIYGKYFSHRRISVGDVAMYEMNFVGNQSHRLSTNEHEKFLSWRIQMLCQSVFNIIIACAFSAFILALLSIKTTEKQFNSLEDFTIKRTHVICNNPYSPAIEYFVSNISTVYAVKPKFIGIYNEAECFKIFRERTDQSICEAESKIALVSTVDDFEEMPLETCPIIQLNNVFPKYYGSFMVRDDFRYLQKFNRMFIQMRSSGVIQRIEHRYRRNIMKKDYGTKREYKVYSEGVQFAHVRYIIYGYSCAIILAIIIVIIENIHYRIKYDRVSRENEKIIDFSFAADLDEDLFREILEN